MSVKFLSGAKQNYFVSQFAAKGKKLDDPVRTANSDILGTGSFHPVGADNQDVE
jgi:hypothetical protein